jgi:hypothetical protein
MAHELQAEYNAAVEDFRDSEYPMLRGAPYNPAHSFYGIMDTKVA